MSEALTALLGALVGGAAAVAGTWYLERRRARRDAGTQVFREIAPFLKRELEIGPRDMPNRSVDLMGQQFAIHGEHPREAFLYAVESLERWSALSGATLSEQATDFASRIEARRAFIEAYRPADKWGTPDPQILHSPDYKTFTAEALASLAKIDRLARSIATRR